MQLRPKMKAKALMSLRPKMKAEKKGPARKVRFGSTVKAVDWAKGNRSGSLSVVQVHPSPTRR